MYFCEWKLIDETAKTRRDFLKATAVTGVGYWTLAGQMVKVSASPSERLAFAGIGIGEKGGEGHRDLLSNVHYGTTEHTEFNFRIFRYSVIFMCLTILLLVS
jgi:hypothetical protein